MIDELIVFFAWVSVVKAQVSVSSIGLSHLEVEADGLGVTDMQIAIGLWRESSMNQSFSEGSMPFQDLWCVADVYISSNQL